MATTATTSMANDTTIPSTPPSSETEERNAELWELLRRSKRRVAQMHAPRIKEEEDSDGDDDDDDNDNNNISDDDGTKSYKTTTPESMSASPFSPSPNNRDFQQERREIEGLLQKSKQRLSYGYDLNKLGEKAKDIVEDVPEINMKTPKKEKEGEQKAATTPETPATPSSATTATPNKYNRAERKNRKMMQKMGMRKVSGITHATFQTSYHGLFYIERPDVYTSASTRQNTHNYKQTFIIFGVTYQQEADDSNEQQQQQQQQQQEHHQNLQQVRQAAQQVTSPSSPSISVIREEDCDGELDDGSDLDPTDIEMVVKQGFCTRTKAIQALRTHEDIVDAVMALRIE